MLYSEGGHWMPHIGHIGTSGRHGHVRRVSAYNVTGAETAVSKDLPAAFPLNTLLVESYKSYNFHAFSRFSIGFMPLYSL